MISKCRLSVFLALFFALSLWTRLCQAQVTQTFRWAFADSSQQISTFLTECQSLKIILDPLVNATAVQAPPPYYLMAFEPEGISTTSFVGTNYSDLTWQVNHAAGTQLMLSMGDGDGNAGGIPSEMYTVVAGTNSSCLPSAPSSNLTLTANVTKDLTTCEPWGLTVTGGVEPYNITIAALGSTLVTNVTLPLGYDVLTYIDRAGPDGQMLAAVSDSSGKFGKTTILVNTKGSTNVDCPGLDSLAGNSTQISAASAAASQAHKAQLKHKTTVLIAACVTVGGVIVFTGAVLFGLCWRRRKRVERGIQDGQDTLPRVFKEDIIDSPESFAPDVMRLPRKQPPMSVTTGSLPDGSSSASASRSLIPPPPGIIQNGANNAHDPSSPPHSSPDHQSSPTTASPETPTSPLVSNADAKTRTRSRTRSGRSTDDGATSSRQVIPPLPTNGSFIHSGVGSSGGRTLDPDTEPDIIIQHRDGGIVQELPPPYLDHRERDRERERRSSQPSPPPLPPVRDDDGEAEADIDVAGGVEVGDEAGEGSGNAEGS